MRHAVCAKYILNLYYIYIYIYIFFKVFFTTTAFADHLTWWTSFGVINLYIVNATFVCKFLRVIVLKFTLHTVLYFVV